jgi:hypothetical protein
LRIRIRDPGLVAFLTPDADFLPIPDPGSGMNNPDHIFKSLETIFLIILGLKYLNSLTRIRDGKKPDPGSGINIPDPQH